LEIAKNRFPFQGAQVKGTFSLPSFYENFDVNNRIIQPEYKAQLEAIVRGIEF
jgi:chromate reductase